MDIVSAQRTGKQSSTKKNILLKMRTLGNKTDIINSCKSQKPSFYANDDLPAEKQTILYVVRQAKKRFPNTVSGCSSSGGKLYAYVKQAADGESSTTTGTTRDRRVPIGNLRKIKAFCTDILGCGLETFIQTWPY